MRITKLEHSGMILEKNGRKIVFDPVEFESKLPELENVVAVIITHKHGDHLQREKIDEIVARNPEVKILATADAITELPEAEIVKAGDRKEVGGFELRFFGENHAEIVPGVVPCQNIGVVVDEVLVNPGDSFDMPEDFDPVWAKIETDSNHKHVDKIRSADVVLICNYTKNGVENYIGANSFAEMFVAYYFDKPIYALNELPDMPYINDEIRSFGVEVLNGDLGKIGEGE